MRAKTQKSLLFLTLMLLSTINVSSVSDPSRGDPLIIDVLMIDRTLGQGGMFYKRLQSDPSISVLAVPQLGHYSIFFLNKNPDAINRAMRIYMPRNYRELVENRDMILLREASCGSVEIPQIIFKHDWMTWFVKAVREEGISFSMWGGDASWGGNGEGDYKSWGGDNPGFHIALQIPGWIQPTCEGRISEAAFHGSGTPADPTSLEELRPSRTSQQS